MHAAGLIAAGGIIGLTATATDDVAVARVEFLVNGALVGTISASPYTYNWNSSTAPDGPVSISARAVDSSNNAAVSASVSLTVDNTPPNTSITSGPAALVNTTTASFGLSSSEANSTFACSLDGAAFGTCTSPAAISGLLNGTHNFQVKATDQAGNTDPTPAAWNWTVDTVPPAVTSTNPSNNARNISPLAVITAAFSEAVNPTSLTGSSFFITVKNSNSPLAAAVAYNSATNTASLTPSAALASSTTYTVTVKGGTGGVKDLAGNAMTTDNSWNFTTGSLDLTPPAVSVTSPAGGAKVHGTITLAANASDNVAVASVDFLVNGSVVGTDTSSPYSVTWNSAALPDGAATITARATDTSLNSTTSAGVSFTIDNTPPNTTIASGPTGTVSSTSASFSFSSTESGSTFACSLDGSAFSACSSPAAYSGLTSATHNFQVRATDNAGNTDAPGPVNPDSSTVVRRAWRSR